jgi:ribosomal protein L40E
MAEETEKCPKCGSTELRESNQFSMSYIGQVKVVSIPDKIKKLKICLKCHTRIYPKELEKWLKDNIQKINSC